MIYSLLVKQEAFDDALEAYLYYEEKQVGLGDRFLNALKEIYQQLSQNLQYFSFVYADKERTLRDVIIEGFPFVVIYEISACDVIVYSVHNTYKNRKL